MRRTFSFKKRCKENWEKNKTSIIVKVKRKQNCVIFRQKKASGNVVYFWKSFFEAFSFLRGILNFKYFWVFQRSKLFRKFFKFESFEKLFQCSKLFWKLLGKFFNVLSFLKVILGNFQRSKLFWKLSLILKIFLLSFTLKFSNWKTPKFFKKFKISPSK